MRMTAFSVSAFYGVLLLACGGRWQHDVEWNGIHFGKLRFSTGDGDTLSVIGHLPADTDIDGYPCGAGWIHFTKDRRLKLFRLAAADTVRNVPLPADAWVLMNPGKDHMTVVFPADTVVQGFPVMGGGGSKGAHTSFYPSGRLRSFFPARDFECGGTRYHRSVLQPVRLSDDGEII